MLCTIFAVLLSIALVLVVLISSPYDIHYRLMQSPPALPLKSPFEEALNSQQNTVSVRIGQEQASSGNILAQKSTSIVEDLRPHEMAQRAVPPRTSAPRSIEFQDKPGYEQFYNELVV